MALFKRSKNIGSFANLNLEKDSNGIHSEEEFRRIIDRERARADRTDHQFSLIVLDLGFTNGNHHTNRRLLQKIISRMRRIDEIGWYNQNRIGIILPYTSERGAQRFSESLWQLFDPSMAECIFNVYTYNVDRTGTK
jgi:hypothetical protein